MEYDAVPIAETAQQPINNSTNASVSASNIVISGSARNHFGNSFHISNSFHRSATSGFERIKILDWLSKLSFRSKHEDIRRESGLLSPEGVLENGKFSGQWLLESTEFSQWRQRDLRKLWYIGMPGAGKTVLASVIIDHLTKVQAYLRPEGAHRIAFLYMSHKERCSTAQLIGSIIRQIIAKGRELPGAVCQLWECCSQGTQDATEGKLKNALREVVNGSSGIFLIIDALDECLPDDRLRLLGMLPELAELSIIVTSRQLDDFRDVSRGFTKVSVQANDADLDIFIDNQFDNHSRLLRLEEHDANIRRNVKHQIKHKCGGV